VQEGARPDELSTQDHYTYSFDIPGIIIKADEEELRMAVYETQMYATDDKGRYLFSLPTGNWRTGTIERDGRQVVRFELPLGFWHCDRHLDYDPAKREGAFSDGDWQSDADIGAMLKILVDESDRNTEIARKKREADAKAAAIADVTPPAAAPESTRPLATAPQQSGQTGQTSQAAPKRKVWPFVLLGCGLAILAVPVFLFVLGWLATVNNW
jgi:hypothetical protein